MEHWHLLLRVLWNTFLALVPVLLAQVIPRMALASRRNKAVVVPIVIATIVWLVFLPNTCYLLTEWRHFLHRLDMSDMFLRSQSDTGVTLLLMVYTVFFFCYSAMGMVAFALAIRPIARLARDRGANLWAWGALLFGMVSVGVYLGLVLRLNSWDLAVRPANVWAAVAGITSHPVLCCFLVFFAGVLWLAYAAIDIWLDGLASRWKEWFPR